MTPERVSRVALSLLVEPGQREMWMLVDEVGPVEALARLRGGAVPQRLVRAAASRLATGDPMGRAEAAIGRCRRQGGRLVAPGDGEWPGSGFDDLRFLTTERDPDVHPPLCLWVRGRHDLAGATERSVAVVGARSASAYGIHVAAELGHGLGDRGWTVVSGGAYGIDAAAHRGALGAGGLTVAVLACGIDTAYPVGNTGLLERIATDGLLVSEWPPGASPQRHRFLIRNRLIAAATSGTVVVEAAARSGALATARRARDLSRQLMAVPGPVTSAMSVGAHHLIREDGAQLVTSAAEVAELVGRIGTDLAAVVRGPAVRRDELDARSARVLDAVPFGPPASPVAIAAESGLPRSEVLGILPVLVLLGYVTAGRDGYRVSDSARLEVDVRGPRDAPMVR